MLQHPESPEYGEYNPNTLFEKIYLDCLRHLANEGKILHTLFRREGFSNYQLALRHYRGQYYPLETAPYQSTSTISYIANISKKLGNLHYIIGTDSHVPRTNRHFHLSGEIHYHTKPRYLSFQMPIYNYRKLIDELEDHPYDFPWEKMKLSYSRRSSFDHPHWDIIQSGTSGQTDWYLPIEAFLNRYDQVILGDEFLDLAIKGGLPGFRESPNLTPYFDEQHFTMLSPYTPLYTSLI